MIENFKMESSIVLCIWSNGMENVMIENFLSISIPC